MDTFSDLLQAQHMYAGSQQTMKHCVTWGMGREIRYSIQRNERFLVKCYFVDELIKMSQGHNRSVIAKIELKEDIEGKKNNTNSMGVNPGANILTVYQQREE